MVRFRHLAAATLGSTYLLMLLGLYTAGTATGLSCGAQWPTCGGGPLGLFPPNVASFAEWLHRLVAMVTGIAILGTAVAAWRRSPGIRRPASVAVALLPLQIGVGALTVTFNGLLPGGFSVPVQVAHFSVALVILAAVVLVTLRAYEADDALPAATARRGALAALAVYPAVVLFGRGVVFTYTASVQMGSYAAGLAAFVALLGVAWSGTGRLRRLAAVALGVLLLYLFLGRGLLLFTGWVPAAYLAVTALLGVAVGAVALVATRRQTPAVPATPAD